MELRHLRYSLAVGEASKSTLPNWGGYCWQSRRG
jgi:hypothetical protein